MILMMHRNAPRRAFKPPNFVDKPQPEKSKVHESQDLTTTSKQIAAQEARKSLQPVKRRKLLVCPVSLAPPTPSPVKKGPSAISAVPSDSGMPVAFYQARASAVCVAEVYVAPCTVYKACSSLMHACGYATSETLTLLQQEQTNKRHSSSGIAAAPGNRSPATGMPQPLPEVQIEQSPALLGASMPLPGEVKVMVSVFLPSCQERRDA